MKVIVITVGIVVVLILLVLIAALFAKKEYTVTRSIVINKPKQVVFGYVKLMKNQDYYNKWVMQDPNMKRTFTGIDGTVGFIYAWDSKEKNAGAGEQEYTEITDGQKLGYEIRFERPMKSVALASMTTEAITDNTTKVEWQFVNSMPYPINAMGLLVNFDKLLGKDMETSLNLLKANIEKN